jgi:transcriptional regulator with XRE-family HTH domain
MVRDLRKSKKLSQAALADLAGTTQSKISGIENGTANVELSTLQNVCAALDAEIAIIPRRAAGQVRSAIADHMNRSAGATMATVQSVRDELFIPDGDDDMDEDQGATR